MQLQEGYALGITLSRLSAYSADDEWNECDHSPSKTSARKKIWLDGVGVYLDTGLEQDQLISEQTSKAQRKGQYLLV